MKKIIVVLFFSASLSAWGQKTSTYTHHYTPEEVKEIFADPKFIEISKNLEDKLAAFPEDKKKLVLDIEIAFRWGTDWPALNLHLESHQRMKPLYAAMNHPKQYLLERFNARPLDKSKVNIPMENGWIKIEEKDLQNQIIVNQLDRLSQVNKALPGFTGWIVEASFRLPWIIVDKPFTEEFCKNSHVYNVKQTVVACQTPDAIKFQKTWYDETASDLKKRTDVFVHELFRYKVMLLAKNRELDQKQQDALTARLSQAFLNPKVEPSAFYEMIQSALLVPDTTNLNQLRQLELVYKMDLHAYMLEQTIAFNANCGTHGYKFDHLFYPYVDKILEQISECRRYLKPDDDDILCSTKMLAFHILDYTKRCYKPLPEKRQ